MVCSTYPLTEPKISTKTHVPPAVIAKRGQCPDLTWVPKEWFDDAGLRGVPAGGAVVNICQVHVAYSFIDGVFLDLSKRARLHASVVYLFSGRWVAREACPHQSSQERQKRGATIRVELRRISGH